MMPALAPTVTLRDAVREAYSAAAADPEQRHPFPLGRELAANLGYPRHLLADLPEECVEAFCGVSNVPLFADLPGDEVVLDLGCGAGLDSLVAARRAAEVIGVDFSPAMIARARRARQRADAANVHFCMAAAEALPLRGASIDVVLVNGIFNLNPARDAIFAELARVTRPGAVVYAAEIVLREPLARLRRLFPGKRDEVPENPAGWFA